ncbi:MAG: hypothetical protein ACFFBD_21850 [Candidatus Hodarchaeota archaeon]
MHFHHHCQSFIFCYIAQIMIIYTLDAHIYPIIVIPGIKSGFPENVSISRNKGVNLVPLTTMKTRLYRALQGLDRLATTGMQSTRNTFLVALHRPHRSHHKVKKSEYSFGLVTRAHRG